MEVLTYFFKLIERYLAAEIDIELFHEKFYLPFVELEVEIDEVEEVFFSEVCEKMDFTEYDNIKISEDEKLFGWITEIEFRDWLKNDWKIFQTKNK